MGHVTKIRKWEHCSVVNTYVFVKRIEKLRVLEEGCEGTKIIQFSVGGKGKDELVSEWGIRIAVMLEIFLNNAPPRNE